MARDGVVGFIPRNITGGNVEGMLKLAGREYQVVSQGISAAQDDWLMGHLRAAGAIEILGDIDRKRTQEQKSEELLTRILISGRKQYIVAGLLTEAGKLWTREDAERNAAAFAQITDSEEKKLMYSQLIVLSLHFFQLGERSSASSPTSSSRKKRVHDTSKEDHVNSETSR
jgi:hypothetical protein